MSDETTEPTGNVRYICATRNPDTKPGYCAFETNDPKLALQHQVSNSHNVIDRMTGQKVGSKIVEPLRFICTKPECGFEAEYVDQARKHHEKQGSHRVVDRIQGVPADHDIAGSQWIQGGAT